MFIQDSRRSYRTYTYFTDTGVPIDTTELIQIQDLLVTGVPVGTSGLIQIQDRTYQIRDLSDAGVPVGTTGLVQMQEYP